MRVAVIVLSLGAFGPDVLAQTAGRERATVYRDAYDVPHIFGSTDESVMFMAAWVQAVADWPQVERNFLRATGRATELVGEEALLDDYLVRALEIPRLARVEYAHATPRMRGLLDAFAEGFDAYLEAHPDARGLLKGVEPWYTLALVRFYYHQITFLAYAGLEKAWAERLLEEGGPNSAAVVQAGDPPGDRLDFASAAVTRFVGDPHGPLGLVPFGSNEWALGPSRTADGTAMLLVNPHVSFFDVEQYVEIHLHSEEGLVFSGLTRYGFLLPYMGHGNRHGWTYTDNYADISDLYVESFDDPADSVAYRYGDGHRTAETWTETIRVKTDEVSESRTLRLWKTHHGPVVGLDDNGRYLTAKLPRLEEGGWFDQVDAMIRARSMEEFRAAIGRLAIPYMNTMYADIEGNIGYVYTSAIPRRDPAFDWGSPVDGSDPATEWNGYHALNELPQVWNPQSGWLMNTNSTPMVATDSVPYEREDFPSYMVGDETDNARARSSRRVLEQLDGATFDDFSRAVWDTRLSLADSIVPLLQDEWERLEADVDPPPAELAAGSASRTWVGEAVRRLRVWDRVADVKSVETTWFVIGYERWWLTDQEGRSGPYPNLQALATTLEDLKAIHGTREVAWGEINRLQRPPSDDPAGFSDELPSLPVGGAPGWAGSIFTFQSDTLGTVERRYGNLGNTFVKVIEFGPMIRGRSVVVFGHSGDPDSPHFFDQAPLYVERRFKPAWFSRAEVEANAVGSPLGSRDRPARSP